MDASQIPDTLDLRVIVAVATNGVIGADGRMPWHYPEDLRHFKETTMGHPVIVGRRTFDSIVAGIDGPLPGRTNIVLSRSAPSLPSDVVHASSLVEAVEAADERDSVAYVIGGATVYEALLPFADQLIVTEIHESYPGDTVFPEWPIGDQWVEVDTDVREQLTFRTFTRRRSDS